MATSIAAEALALEPRLNIDEPPPDDSCAARFTTMPTDTPSRLALLKSMRLPMLPAPMPAKPRGTRRVPVGAMTRYLRLP